MRTTDANDGPKFDHPDSGVHPLSPNRRISPGLRAVASPHEITAGTRPENPPHSREFDPLDPDYARARYWRAQAELCRDQWTAGRQAEIEQVRSRAQRGDNRFLGLTDEQLVTIARVRWSRSALAGKLAARQELYMRWSTMYLAFAEYHLQLAANQGRLAREQAPAQHRPHSRRSAQVRRYQAPHRAA